MIKVRDLLGEIDLSTVIGRHMQLTKRGREYVGLCPFHDDHSPSFNVIPHKGFAHCFACGWSGNAIDFLMQFSGLSFKESARELINANGVNSNVETRQLPPPKPRAEPPRWISERPPAGTPPPSFVTRLGKPETVWPYPDTDSRPLGYVARYMDAGRKIVLCWSWGVDVPTQSEGITPKPPAWACRHFSKPRPLFGLDLLQREGQVIVVEGEKTAVAARELFPDFVVITWPGGCPGVKFSDWRPLLGRDVLLIPDHDDAGRQAMAWLGQNLTTGPDEVRSQRCRVILPEDDRPKGWDLADVAWTPAEALSWASSREPMLIEDWPQASQNIAGDDDEPLPVSEAIPAPNERVGRHEPAYDEGMSAAQVDNIDLWAGYDDLEPARPYQAPAGNRLDWSALAGAKPPEREWAVNHWLGMGHVTMLAGAGGIGKSLLSQTLASAIALGVNYIGEISQARRVLIWSTEDDHDELWRRQVAIAKYFNVPLTAFANLVIVPRLGMDNTLLELGRDGLMWKPTWGDLDAAVKENNAEVLFVDNVAQCCGNEIDRHVVTTFCNAFAGIKPGLATVLLAHPGRALGSEFSGSSAWENAVRMRWYIGAKLPDQEGPPDEETDSDIRFLCKRKANYSSKDFQKLRYVDGVFCPESSPDTQYISRHAMGVANQIVLDAITWLAEAGYTCTDKKNSDEYLPRLMLRHKRHQHLTLTGAAKAMDDLIQQGKLKRAEVGRYANRGVKLGLVIAQD